MYVAIGSLLSFLYLFGFDGQCICGAHKVKGQLDVSLLS